MICWLLRHCEPDVSSEICLGQLDVALTEAGVVHAKTLPSFFKEFVPTRVISSDLARAQQTAQPLAQTFGLPVHLDARWRELDMGEFTGRSWQDIHQQQPDVFAQWGENFAYCGPPKGESFIALQNRVVAAFAEDASANTVFVTHAGAIRALLGHLRKLSAAAAMQLPIAYGEFVEIDVSKCKLR
jgi:broad specificity phosphatase PhoE